MTPESRDASVRYKVSWLGDDYHEPLALLASKNRTSPTDLRETNDPACRTTEHGCGSFRLLKPLGGLRAKVGNQCPIRRKQVPTTTDAVDTETPGHGGKNDDSNVGDRPLVSRVATRNSIWLHGGTNAARESTLQMTTDVVSTVHTSTVGSR